MKLLSYPDDIWEGETLGGETVAVVSLPPRQLRSAGRREIAQARLVETA
jgi:hypothetical protein